MDDKPSILHTGPGTGNENGKETENSSSSSKNLTNQKKETGGKRKAPIGPEYMDCNVQQQHDQQPQVTTTTTRRVKRIRVVAENGMNVILEVGTNGLNENCDEIDNKSKPTENTEMVEFTVKPALTGEPFRVAVPKHGCLFDLYDAIYMAIRVPWEKQLLFIDDPIMGKQELASGERDMLGAPLPVDGSIITLAIRMNSGVLESTTGVSGSSCIFADDVVEEMDIDMDGMVLMEYEDGNGSVDVLEVLNNKPELIQEPVVVESVQCEPQPAQPAPQPQPSNRCFKCRAKCRPGLQFTCKCGNTFCHVHRYHDQHACPVDIVSLDKAGLSMMNPRVVKDRL